MENLEKALKLRKAKYTKRTGGPGHYKYVYKKPVGRKKKKVIEGRKPIKKEKVAKDVIEKQVKKAYDWIFKATKNEFEAAAVLDTDGSILIRRFGEESSVNIKDLVPLMKGKIFLHNHPNGASFSDNDIFCALGMGMQEIRAVGEQYEYIYHPKEQVLLETEEGQKEMRAIGKFFSMQNHVVYERDWPRIASGKITAEDAAMNHWHEIIGNFVKEFGGSYEKRKRG